MKKEDKKKLIANRRYIVGHLLDLESVLDYLISKEIFTPAIRERIVYENRVPRDRIRQTLDYLYKCGPNSFNVFLEALVISGNAHVANVLDNSFCDSDKCKTLVESELKYSIVNNNRVTTTSSCCNSKKTSRIQSPIGLRHENLMTSPRLLMTATITSPRIGQELRENPLLITPLGQTPVQHRPSRHVSPAPPAPMRHISPQTKFPVTVASCQINSAQFMDDYDSNRQELDWDDINNLDLDFEVLSNDTQQIIDTDGCNYKMTSEPRGICLIINNEHFYDNDQNEIQDLRRYGTDLDASRLKSLFEKLKFQIQFEYDLTETELKNKIQLFAIELDRNGYQYDAACLIILSHGTDGYIYGVDFENKINVS